MLCLNLGKNCGWIANEAKIMEWVPNNWYCTDPNCYFNQFFDYKNFEAGKDDNIPNLYLCMKS